MSSTAFYMRQKREGGRQRTLWQGAAAGGAFASWCDMWRQIEVMYMSLERALYVELELELELGKCDLQLGAECGVDQHGAARAIEVIVN